MHQIDYRYMRPKKAAALKKMHEAPVETRSELTHVTVHNAVILPLRKTDAYGWTGQGGVVDSHGNYVEQSATYSFVRGGYSFESPVFVDKKVVYCGYLIQHWGHFLVDSVSRLWYFLEDDPTVDKYVFILSEAEEREISGNYREFLTLLKIWDKLEIINTPTAYREVIVPELGFQRGQYYSPKYTQIFDTVAENIIPEPSWRPLEKIYWSRSQLKKSNEYEFGFDAFDDYFEKNGFTVMYPERVPLSQLIFYVRHAKLTAAVSGTLPHNMLFGYQGQNLLILERCAINNDWQVCVNCMKELNTTYIDANISLYTVPMSGPFIMGYNQQVQRYTEDHGYLPPDSRFLSEKHFRSCFVKYMKVYQNNHRYQWFIQEYLLPEIDYHAEAYEEGYQYFGDYLNGSKPFFWHHYFELHYWKQFVKRILRFLK